MKIKAERNTTLIYMGQAVLLVSYSTPVALFTPSKGYQITDKKWSITTTRHINKFLAGSKAAQMPQSYFDTLLEKEGGAL